MLSPSVSVIIPSYNSAPYLAETLGSVLAQTYPPHEIIVIDDGSTDNTVEVLAPFRTSIRYVKQCNSGAAAARNHGLDLANGEWVAFIDSDDVWHQEKLAKQVAYINSCEDKSLVCVFSWFFIFGEREWIPECPIDIATQPIDDELLIVEALVHPSTALVRRDNPVRFHAWGIPSEDMIYFAELSQVGSFGFVDGSLAGYRKRAGSVTKREGHIRRSLMARQRWIEEVVTVRAPGRAEKLLQRLYQGLGDAVVLARWIRDWSRYWQLRELLKQSWPYPDPPPAVVNESVYLPFVYWVKDCADRVVRTRREPRRVEAPHRRDFEQAAKK